jgi:hypothetical protein
VERNYGATNCIHGFNKEKEKGFFFLSMKMHTCVVPCMIHKI